MSSRRMRVDGYQLQRTFSSSAEVVGVRTTTDCVSLSSASGVEKRSGKRRWAISCGSEMGVRVASPSVACVCSSRQRCGKEKDSATHYEAPCAELRLCIDVNGGAWRSSTCDHLLSDGANSLLREHETSIMSFPLWSGGSRTAQAALEDGQGGADGELREWRE